MILVACERRQASREEGGLFKAKAMNEVDAGRQGEEEGRRAFPLPPLRIRRVYSKQKQ